MHRIAGRAGILAVAALAALAVLPVSAAALRSVPANAVLLRYRFVAGQSYAYRMTVTMHTNISGGGVVSSAGLSAVTMSAIVSERILKVDAGGAADARMSVSNMAMTVTIAGRSSTQSLIVPPQTVHIGADGSQRGSMQSVLGSYGVQTVAALPGHPIAPGARWTSTSRVSLPPLLGAGQPALQMSVQYLFTKLITADGQPAADIHSSGALDYRTDTVAQGQPVHMHLTQTMAGLTIFGLDAHRMITSQAHLDIHMFASAKGHAGVAVSALEHVIVDASMQHIGW